MGTCVCACVYTCLLHLIHSACFKGELHESWGVAMCPLYMKNIVYCCQVYVKSQFYKMECGTIKLNYGKCRIQRF